MDGITWHRCSDWRSCISRPTVGRFQDRQFGLDFREIQRKKIGLVGYLSLTVGLTLTAKTVREPVRVFIGTGAFHSCGRVPSSRPGPGTGEWVRTPSISLLRHLRIPAAEFGHKESQKSQWKFWLRLHTSRQRSLHQCVNARHHE
jgi:hypothetical protein